MLKKKGEKTAYGVSSETNSATNFELSREFKDIAPYSVSMYRIILDSHRLICDIIWKHVDTRKRAEWLRTPRGRYNILHPSDHLCDARRPVAVKSSNKFGKYRKRCYFYVSRVRVHSSR